MIQDYNLPQSTVNEIENTIFQKNSDKKLWENSKFESNPRSQ